MDDTGAPPSDASQPKCGDGTTEGAELCTIDLTQVVYHSSLDVSAWPVTKTIIGVDLLPLTQSVKAWTSPSPAT